MNTKSLSIACLLLTSVTSQAQSLRVVPEAYPLQVAPSPDLPIRPMQRAMAPTVDLSLQLKSGDLVVPRLVEWAARNGYALTWEAPDFRSGADLVLSGEFEKSLDEFLGSMRMNQVRLEAEIYANKTVRIQEVK